MAVGVDAGASGGWDGMGEQVVGVVSERVRRRKGEDGEKVVAETDWRQTR